MLLKFFQRYAFLLRKLHMSRLAGIGEGILARADFVKRKKSKLKERKLQ
jgi:hypothetical protein